MKYRGIRALAKAVGRSPGTVSRWLDRDDWPSELSRNGPWSKDDVSRIQAWMHTLAPTDEKPSATAQLTKVKTLLALERQKMLKHQREIAEGKFHDAEWCKTRRLRAVTHCRDELLAIAPGLPLEPAQQDIVHRAIVRVLTKFSQEYVPEAAQ